MRLSKVIKEFNVSLQRVVDVLQENGITVEANPNSKIDDKYYDLLAENFGADRARKHKAAELFQGRREEKQAAREQARADREAEKAAAQAAAQAEAEKIAAEEAEKAAKAEQAAKAELAAKAEKEEMERKKAEAAAQREKKNQERKAEEQEKPAQKVGKTNDSAGDKPRDKQDAPKKEKNREEAARKKKEDIGTVSEDGIFKLNSTPSLDGPKVLGTIDLSNLNSNTRPKKKKDGKKGNGAGGEKNGGAGGEKKKRNRIGRERVDIAAESRNNQGAGGEKNGGNKKKGQAGGGQQQAGGGKNQQNAGGQNGKKRGKNQPKQEPQAISDEDVARQVKETLARLQGKTKGAKGAKYRKEKREAARERAEEEIMLHNAEAKTLKLTEFVTANELATMMDVPVTKVIATCMSIGIMVSINQRLDQETIDLVAEEFGFSTEYVSAEVSEAIEEVEDREEDLRERAPIVTVMGHVDHGKTSLLDHIRNANVIAGEAGGITQHIGAYNVRLKNGREITFLDTPGHEAFTAMRARGAQVTDIAIIIIAADDNVMPQTKEAINHAVAAGVPIVFAINKIDKPGANPDAIKTTLASMNFLVEEWGGKYQSQDISAKKGIGVYELLEKVLLEADMLELKANPNRNATGTVIESSLDKGRGYVATVLVSNGTLHQGDIVVAGTNYGRVKALFNERGQRISDVGPAHAATLLGFNGAPQAGDQFHVMSTEQEAREIASKRLQLQREQNFRTAKMLTLDEIGRRLKIGDYQELNIVVKGDVDGSVQALSDSFIRLSTESIQVNVIHKGVGQISENDVTLAAASKAVIIGFQVRPSAGARKLAEREGVDIRQYSIIYDAIEEVKEAMEGMLKPIVKEEVTAMVEVRQVYHISKVGYVAGAYVVDGKVSRSNKARIIREGVVIYTGEIDALKRFKDDVKEVTTNFECGISLKGCQDIKEGDIIETFTEIEVKQKLS